MNASKKSAAPPVPTAHPAPWLVCSEYPWMIVDRRGRRIADFMVGSFSREWAIENARAAVAAYNATAEREEREAVEYDEALAAEREQ